ncbi:hypothetical protein BsWGS_02030 [Bradybaena similaris]
MESISLDMDDIFGEDDAVEDFNPSRLPDLEDELEPMREVRNEENDDDENVQEDTENAELMAKLKSMKGASKHVTKKSLPKLDANRLTGERGIPVLPKIFKDVPLKGKNHEKEDLKLIMQTLEHWAHRLFPKMTFGEVLERTERLGAKKEVQACVKRIRLDMPVLVTDHFQDDDDDVSRTGDNDNEESDHRNDDSGKENEIDDEEIEELLREQVLPVDSLFRTDDDPLQPQEKQTEVKNGGLTDELKEKIERNKKLAMERRAAKLAQQNQVSVSENENSAINNPSDNEKSLVPEVQVAKETQHEQLQDKLVTDAQSNKLFTEDSDSELHNSAVNIPTSDNEMPPVPEVQVAEETQHEKLHDKLVTDAQSDKRFTEDNDSELQNSAVSISTSDNEKSSVPEVQVAKETQHEQLHDKLVTDVQSDTLFTKDSDSELQNIADDM